MTTSLFDLIKTKREGRSFQDRPLPDDAIREILEAGRLAGSSKNRQPWHFIAIRDKATLLALSQTGDYAGHLAGAAFGVAIVSQTPRIPSAYDYDFGRATQNMMLAAWAHGVTSCPAAIYEPGKAAAILGVPEGYHCEWAISFGYPVEQAPVPPRKSGRRMFDEVVHWEKW